jgi:predicted AAA+ superfamily ATPase
MKNKIRYISSNVKDDLEKKMVFIGGPRQVGKTTFSKSISNDFSYLNWDEASHREMILKNQLPDKQLIILDEIHKYKLWRNWVKGKYDTLKDHHQFLITGSAKLDIYRYGGDSLQGRFFSYRLHPFSVHELKIKNKKDFMDLLNLSGFPDPFLSGKERDYKRWSRDYRTRLIRDDITSLERVEDLGSLELLMLRLPDLVGSPLSINSLREDLQKSFKTVSRWLDIFERTYGLYRIASYGPPRIKAVKKEQKHYHFDWALPGDQAKRFENLVAGHLLKYCHFMEDTEGDVCELRFFKDIEGREVDFVVIKNKKPIYFIEVKSSGKEISSHLIYLKRKFPEVMGVQLHLDEKVDYIGNEGIRVCPAWKFLNELGV